MNEFQRIVEQKQKRRYELLLALWIEAGCKERSSVSFQAVAEKSGFTEEEYGEIFNYFNAEGFFVDANFGSTVSLSHSAIREIENSLNHPQQSTEHFQSTVIQNFHGAVGAVQTGNQNIANVNQNIGQNFSEILEQLAHLKREFQALPDGDREKAIEVIDAIAEEVKSESPSKGKIKSFLLATKDFAVKTGTELAASTLAKLLESQMGIKS